MKCIAGCKIYTGHERYHHKDCPYYPESFSKRFDLLQADNARLRRVIRGALEIKSLWMRPLSQTVTIQQRDERKALWIMEKQFDQALKNKCRNSEDSS